MFISELFFDNLNEGYATPMPIADMIKASGGDIEVGDKIRTKKMQMVGVVTKIQPERAWATDEIFFRVADGRTMKTPRSNCVKINPEFEDSSAIEEESRRRKKESDVHWIPVDTVQHPLGTPYSPKNKYLANPNYNTRTDTKTIDEFAPSLGDGEGGEDDKLEKLLQLYIAVASKINVKRLRVQTALRKIAEIMATKVPVVSDDFVDFSYQVARQRQGMPNMLDSHNIDEGDIVELPTSWDKNISSQGNRVSMSHGQAHKIMTSDEYLRDRDKLGPHDFDPNVGGEQGTVGIRYTANRPEIEEGKGKKWDPIEDSSFAEWPEYGHTKDGKKSIKSEVKNEDDYRDELERNGWILDQSNPIDPGYAVYINKGRPGEQIHVIPNGYYATDKGADIVIVTSEKINELTDGYPD